MAMVRVRYFASLRELKGAEVEVVELLPGESLEALYQRLCPPGRLPVAFARNAATASRQEVPLDGDEVAFLPPIGGG